MSGKQIVVWVPPGPARKSAATVKAKKNKQKKKGAQGRSLVNYSSPSLSGNGTYLAATSYTQSLPTKQPKFSGGVNCVRIVHREFIADLQTTATFSTYSGSLNPGLSGLFPWLSRLAPMFESYSFRRLKFHVVPMCSSTTAGQIFMAIDYDAADAAPSSKTEMMSYAGATPMGLWQPFSMAATGRDENTLGRRRFVRAGDVPTNTDIKTYDVGSLFVGSAGAAGTATTSSLYVEYDVDLYTPQFSISALASATSAKVTAGGTVSKTSWLGTAATKIGDLAVSALTNTLTFTKVGQYLVDLLIAGTGLVDGVNPVVSGSASITSTVGTLANAGGTAASYSAIVEITEPGQTLALDWNAAATTVTNSTSRIGQYAYANA